MSTINRREFFKRALAGAAGTALAAASTGGSVAGVAARFVAAAELGPLATSTSVGCFVAGASTIASGWVPPLAEAIPAVEQALEELP